MARKLRIQYEGAIRHVTIRGVDRRAIFDDDDYRERFLKRLGDAVEEYSARLYLFCLMSNHAIREWHRLGDRKLKEGRMSTANVNRRG